MFDQVRQFMDTFRDLEKKESVIQQEDVNRRERLRQALTVPVEPDVPVQWQRYVLAIASLYPQAGASFIAGNLAYYEANRNRHVILAELPKANPYYYFSLDSEARGETLEEELLKGQKVVMMQRDYLQIITSVPQKSGAHVEVDLTSWYFQHAKASSLFVIDLSSEWKNPDSTWIMEAADEVWFVVDTDFPRLARTIVMEEAPSLWQKHGNKKIRIIANKWTPEQERSSLLKKLEGTMALWASPFTTRPIDLTLPMFHNKKVMDAHSNATLLLEAYPELAEEFIPLSSILERS